MNLVKASGGGDQKRHKGDLIDDIFLIEQKDTEAKSMSVKKAWIEKINHEARMKDKIPAVIITIDGLTSVLISAYDFKLYRFFLQKMEEEQ
jgi:hypothetical protein